MRKLTSAMRGVAGIVLTTMMSVALAAQTAPPGQDGFKAATAEDLAAGQEHLPATPFVFWAYGIVWLVLAIYVLSLWRRIAKTEREVAALRAKLEVRP
ncbi:MAG: CcmD family protein [Acidobacteriota bacterium]